MSVTLRPITRDNFRECVRLKVAEEQTNFVATNVTSIAQVYLWPNWQPLAIYNDEQMVGFVMYGAEEEPFRYWVIRLMVDAQFQGKGYGRAGLQAAIEQMRERYTCNSIHISYVPENTGAAALYKSLGFVETGEVDDGEIVARLDF